MPVLSKWHARIAGNTQVSYYFQHLATTDSSMHIWSTYLQGLASSHSYDLACCYLPQV